MSADERIKNLNEQIDIYQRLIKTLEENLELRGRILALESASEKPEAPPIRFGDTRICKACGAAGCKGECEAKNVSELLSRFKVNIASTQSKDVLLTDGTEKGSVLLKMGDEQTPDDDPGEGYDFCDRDSAEQFRCQGNGLRLWRDGVPEYPCKHCEYRRRTQQAKKFQKADPTAGEGYEFCEMHEAEEYFSQWARAWCTVKSCYAFKASIKFRRRIQPVQQYRTMREHIATASDRGQTEEQAHNDFVERALSSRKCENYTSSTGWGYPDTELAFCGDPKNYRLPLDSEGNLPAVPLLMHPGADKTLVREGFGGVRVVHHYCDGFEIICGHCVPAKQAIIANNKIMREQFGVEYPREGE